MSAIDPIPGDAARIEPLAEPCGEGARASRATRAFSGLLEDAIRRLDDLDRGLASSGRRADEPTLEGLAKDLREAERAMQSAEEIRALLLRAYRGAS
jgi:hypothetical protein